MSNGSIWPIERTLSDDTPPGLSGNEGVLHIPQSFSITGTLPLGYLVSYQDIRWEFVPLGRDAVGVFCCPSRLAYQQR